MPYVASLDVIVDMQRFINIDLLSQGLYFIAVSIRTRPDVEHGAPGVVARPFDFHEKKPTDKEETWAAHAPCTLLDPDNGRLCSRGFYIRYCEQIESLRLRCGFHVTVDALRLFKAGGDDLLIRFDLHHISKDALEKDYGKAKPMYARARGAGGTGPQRYEPYSKANIKKIAAAVAAGAADVVVKQDGQTVTINLQQMEEVSADGHIRKVTKSFATIPHAKFEVKSTREFPLKLAAVPHTEWVPVSFDSWYFSRVDTFMTMVLSGIHYIPPPAGAIPAGKAAPAGTTRAKAAKAKDPSSAFQAAYGITTGVAEAGIAAAPPGATDDASVDPVHDIEGLPTVLVSYLTYAYYALCAWMGGLQLPTELEALKKECEKEWAAKGRAASVASTPAGERRGGAGADDECGVGPADLDIELDDQSQTNATSNCDLDASTQHLARPGGETEAGTTDAGDTSQLALQDAAGGAAQAEGTPTRGDGDAAGAAGDGPLTFEHGGLEFSPAIVATGGRGGEDAAGRELEIKKHHRITKRMAKKAKKARRRNGHVIKRRFPLDTAWHKVVEGLRERPALVCHFRYAEAQCVKDAERCVRLSMHATKTVESTWVGLHDTSHNGLQTVLAVLSENVAAAWQHIQTTYASHETLWGGIHETEARKSYFRAIEKYCKTRLEGPPAAGSGRGGRDRPSPYTPLYYSYDTHTEVTISEVCPKEAEVHVANKAMGAGDGEGSVEASLLQDLEEQMIFNPCGTSLVVFVHGWKGNSCDLSIFKNFLHLYIHDVSPSTDFLCVRAMEDNANCSIKKLGDLVAAETAAYIGDNHNGRVARLSFVGHSMGCLVIRACIQSEALAAHVGSLHTFVSLSGPHLGVPAHERGSISCALGLISSVQRSKNIREMRLDSTFLHSLSTTDFIGRFKHVLLFGSDNDQFVNPSSALALPALSSLKVPAAKAGMVEDIARNITAASSRCTTCRRFVVRFAPHGRAELTSKFDRVVGKDVHISFLVDVNFLNIVVNLFKDYLK